VAGGGAAVADGGDTVIVFVDVGAGGGEELHAASVKATMVKAKHPVNLPIEWKCGVGRLLLSREPVHSEPQLGQTWG
jgi:hypothetical protein